MLQRLYVNNFRCLVNFELKLDRLNLLLGVNGCGKSSAFDVLRKLQDFVINEEVASDVFPLHDKTEGLNHDIQRFELDISVGNDDNYSYKLDIQHDIELKKAQVSKEELSINGKPLFIYSDGMAHLYRDDHTSGPEYPFNMWRSGVGYLSERKDNKKLIRFKRELERFVVVRPIPDLMENPSPNEDNRLAEKMQNFPSWYRYASQAHGELGVKLATELGDVLPSFRHLKFDTLGENHKLLKVDFDPPDRGRLPLSLNFKRLSDGQKMLIALYTLLFYSTLQEQGISLFIDEPDNFLALREIQPWLSTLASECGDTIEQAILISHHPEVIDYLGNANGRWFFRDGTNPVQVSDELKNPMDVLSLSETVARGWEQ
ncbi:MAG: AAA family ATPase [Proteobacteria bacterium]|nr:AAA family ATPase [Pseudomonadota bacterium]